MSAEKLVRQCISRIEAVENTSKPLNAVCWINPQAQEISQALDEELKVRGARSRLHGVPFLLKDNMDLAGSPTTAGCKALEGNLAVQTSLAVSRLIAAGAIPLGKSNMSELGQSFGWLGYSSLLGTTRNPHDLDRTASGSSSGAAAAVAAGLVPFALGSDTTGSIRAPAAACGVVGFRATHGTITTNGLFPLAPSLDVIGPIANCIEDVEIIHCTMAGLEAASPKRNYPWRIGVVDPLPSDDTSLTEKVSSLLRSVSSKHQIVKIKLPEKLLELGELASRRIDAEFPNAYAAIASRLPFAISSLTGLAQKCEEIGRTNPATVRWVERMGQQADGFVKTDMPGEPVSHYLDGVFSSKGIDVMLFPTITSPAGFLEERTPSVGTPLRDAYRTCYLAGFSGRPEVSLPLSRNSDELPFGISLLGCKGRDLELLEIGRKISEFL